MCGRPRGASLFRCRRRDLSGRGVPQILVTDHLERHNPEGRPLGPELQLMASPPDRRLADVVADITARLEVGQ